MENGRFAFLCPLGGGGLSGNIGKRVVYFLLALIELLSLAVEALRANID